MELPIINGVKCYPACRWETNQHKMYNAMDKAHNKLSDALEEGNQDHIDKAIDWLEKVETVCSMFNNHIVGQTVFLPYKQYVICKEILSNY